MKATRILALLFALLLLLGALAACNETTAPDTDDKGTTGGTSDGTSDENKEPSLWDSAKYKEDKTLGEGKHTLSISMEMEGKVILLTIKTDAKNVKDALLENGLIEGEQQAIGYMMTHFNGVRADYEKDGAYWALYQGGEYMMTGIDSTPVEGDASYEFVYTPA